MWISCRLARGGGALVIGLALASVANLAGAERPALRFDPQTTLELVARRMNVTLRPDVRLPRVRLESATTIERFRDAVETQWGSRPARFSNAFVPATNEVYLIDDPDYYAATGRTLDDSLAHELVHYLQVYYRHANVAGEFQELEAVEIQSWFRAEHMHTKLADASGRRNSLPR